MLPAYLACRLSKGIQPVPDSASATRRLLLASAAVALVGSAQAQTTGDSAQIKAIMERYALAMRNNDVEALVALYTNDGVFMREGLPAIAGTEALRAGYRTVFGTLKLDLAFEIEEAEVAGDMAWLRGTSTGRIKILATGAESEDSFNLLVVFRRDGGSWKIRCYLYASNKPGAGTPK
jgi:uncharacterized protein (TIGR02246 family)